MLKYELIFSVDWSHMDHQKVLQLKKVGFRWNKWGLNIHMWSGNFNKFNGEFSDFRLFVFNINYLWKIRNAIRLVYISSIVTQSCLVLWCSLLQEFLVVGDSVVSKTENDDEETVLKRVQNSKKKIKTSDHVMV